MNRSSVHPYKTPLLISKDVVSPPGVTTFVFALSCSNVIIDIGEGSLHHSTIYDIIASLNTNNYTSTLKTYICEVRPILESNSLKYRMISKDIYQKRQTDGQNLISKL